MKKLTVILICIIVTLVSSIIGYVICVGLTKAVPSVSNDTPVSNNIAENNISVKNSVEEKVPKILGTYTIKSNRPTTAFTYIFSIDKVIYKNDGYNEGTYTINNDNIYITYNKTLSPDDNTPMDFIRKPETLTIENENILVSENGTKFYKTKGE